MLIQKAESYLLAVLFRRYVFHRRRILHANCKLRWNICPVLTKSRTFRWIFHQANFLETFTYIFVRNSGAYISRIMPPCDSDVGGAITFFCKYAALVFVYIYFRYVVIGGDIKLFVNASVRKLLVSSDFCVSGLVIAANLLFTVFIWQMFCC